MLTREKYLKLRQEGMSRTHIQRNYFPSNPTKFYSHLTEWGIKEKDAEERELDLMPPIKKDVSGQLADAGTGTPDQKDEKVKRAESDSQAVIKELKEVIAEKDREIAELTSDRDMLLQTIELSATNDPVNHPAHYNAGKVECIDAIEAATTGLTGGQAYSTGAAIKYLWRWSRKGGAEDLKKARWYIDRLITELEAQSS